MGQIRNIIQTVQDRDVIKQASDVVVYINGENYLINPYLSDSGEVVPFNDFLTNWQSTYGVEQPVPSGSLTLSVPSHHTRLFQAPGGNNILKTMDEIRVYAKGYYFSASGNTLYHQIFRGFISSISYSITEAMTTISMSCQGSLGLLAMMQIDVHPDAISNSPLAVQPGQTTTWNLDPYDSMAYQFLYPSMIDGFSIESITQARLDKHNVYFEAIKHSMARWQALLYDIARDVHIFGCPHVSDVIKGIHDHIRPDADPGFKSTLEMIAQQYDKYGIGTENAQRTAKGPFINKIRSYMPEMTIGDIKMVGGRYASRLERFRYFATLIGFESYQDVDGTIVAKMPLYNLDVMQLDPLKEYAMDPNSDSDASIDPSLVGLTASNNPFVVYLSEIISENEAENEAGVRFTRLTGRGALSTGWQIQTDATYMATAEDIDLNKLTQFGLRTEPAIQAGWFKNTDEGAIYAHVASELAKANRGFRTYSLSIPLRPELRVGFPMFLPHRDMYGYIQTVSMNWSRGSTATTTVTLDSLRRRVLIPVDQEIPAPEGSEERPTVVRLMEPQNNLVNTWSLPPTSSGANKDANKTKFIPEVTSLPFPESLVFNQQILLTKARQIGADYAINTDDKDHCWRIQQDAKKLFDHPRQVDEKYYEDLKTCRPYTDNKGYELIGPFPWGRWKCLKVALTEFILADALFSNTKSSSELQPPNSEATPESGAAAFLFTGDSAAPSYEYTLPLINDLAKQAATVTNSKIFELTYDNPSPSSQVAPPKAADEPDPNDVVQARAKTLLSGKPEKKANTDYIMASISKAINFVKSKV